MKSKKTRIMSALLATSVSVMSLTPLTALAAQGDKGTAENPYHITAANELAEMANDLDGYYILDCDISLEAFESWTPVGNMTYSKDVDMTTGEMDMSKVFSGTFDGNGYTISDMTCNVDGDMMAGGLFAGFTGEIFDLTLDNFNVNGNSVSGNGATATGGVVGYAMAGKIDNVTIKNSTVSGTNCTGGVAGGNMAAITNSTADNVNIIVTGDNDFSENNRIIQCDVAECGGALVGGGFTGTVNNCTAKNSTISAAGNEPVGLGGLAGCLQSMSEIKGNTVENVTIKTEKGGHAIGGLCGYAGTGFDGSDTISSPANISDNTVNITINAENATHVGGLVGTCMYYFGMEDRFATQNNVVSGTIFAGTNETSVYGKSSAGAVSGRATGSDVSGVDFSALTINGVKAVNAVGENKYLYESADQSDNTDGAALINGLSGYSFGQLFEGGLFNEEYNKYWHDYCAVIVGEDNADAMVAMMKSSIGADTYGKNAVDGQMSFYCGFTNGIADISFDGTIISGTDKDGNVIFSHAYRYIGLDENVGMYKLESLDENSGEFTYFFMWPDTPSTTGHIEFRYGSNADDLVKLYEGDYAFWMAAGLPDGATEQDIEDCIALFCLENMDYSQDRTDAPQQREDFVGTWDYYDGTQSNHDFLYFTVDENGNGSTYYLGENDGNYMVFAYDNDGNDNEKSGIYVSVNNGEAKKSKYKIEEIDNKTILTLTGTDENGDPFTIQYVKVNEPDNSSSELDDNSSSNADSSSSNIDSSSSSSDSSSSNSDSSSSATDTTTSKTNTASSANPSTGSVPVALSSIAIILGVIMVLKKKK